MPRALPVMPSLRSRLTAEENDLRDALFARLLETGVPLDRPEESAGVLRRLVDKGMVALDGAGRIAFAYPVSALPTPHRVTLADGRAFHAMCAVDALGAAFTFRQPARVESSCSHCEGTIFASVDPGGEASVIPTGLRVLHVDLTRRRDWAATS